MVKNMLVMLTFLVASTTYAAGKIPDMDRWIKKAIPKVDSSRIVQKILFVKADGKVYTPWMPIKQKDPLDLINAEFISVVNPNDIDMCSKLNVEIIKSKSSFKLSTRPSCFSDFFKCSKADTLLSVVLK